MNRMNRQYIPYENESDQIPTGIPVSQNQFNPNIPPQFPQPSFNPNIPPQQHQQFAPSIYQQINPNYPMTMTCQSCHNVVNTIVNQQSGNTTYLWAFCLCCTVGNWCCCPFILDSCLDKVHYCPNCGHNIVRKHQKCFEFLG